MRWVIFSRVSGDLQLDESQLYMCRTYVNSVKKPGDEVIEFNEPPTSTRFTMDKRPVLLAMLEFLKRGDTLVVFCLTRLARTGTEIVKIYEEHITNKKAILHSIGQPKVDKNFIHIYAMMGEMARDTISANTKAGLLSKQAQMHKVGTCWYGYKTDPNVLQLQRERAHSYGKPYLLIPDEQEQANIALMQELRAQDYSYQAIADMLKSKGIKNRKGGNFLKKHVWNILNRLEKNDLAPKELAYG